MTYEQARTHMVDCQIHPSGVVSEGILEAFSTIPREMFVSEDRQSVAYVDNHVALPGGRFLIEPTIHAKLVQAADPKPDDVVLDIGGASGYSAAIFSPLVTTVVALESDKALLDQAAENWQELDVCNVASVHGPLNEGCLEHGPYSLIFINGAIEQIPSDLLDQLQEDGRLLAVVMEEGYTVGQATLFKRCGKEGVSECGLFDANVPCLPEFKAEHEFVF